MKFGLIGSGSLLLISLLSTSACTDHDKKMEEVVETKPVPKEHEFTVDETSGKVEFKAEIVYFEFDDSTLTSQGIERLNALASYMDKNKDLKVKVEGHCDERGSAEYNLALGQRRAESVRKFLADAGVVQDRLLAVSFGEERLANNKRSEKDHAENRRVEFTFDGFNAIAKAPQVPRVQTQESTDNRRSSLIVPASESLED